VTYNNTPLIDIIEHKSHPAMHRQPGEPQVEYNTLYDEFATAEAFGWQAYAMADRQTRALMVGHHRAKGIIQLLYRHDTMPKTKGKEKL